MPTTAAFSNIEFTNMTLELLPQIMDIELQAYPIPWRLQSFKDCITKDYHCQIMMQENNIIGYFILQEILDELHILNICIIPEHQGNGLGCYQLKHIINQAEKQFMNRILLEVRASNKAARGLYLNSGFQQIGKRKNYYPSSENKREDALVLELALG